MSINLPTPQVVEEVLREARHVDDGKLRLALDKPRLFVGLDHWHANMQSTIDSAIRRLGDLVQLFARETNYGS